jgi:hypothetical protein
MTSFIVIACSQLDSAVQKRTVEHMLSLAKTPSGRYMRTRLDF